MEVAIMETPIRTRTIKIKEKIIQTTPAIIVSKKDTSHVTAHIKTRIAVT